MISIPEINQISHLTEVVDLFRSVTERLYIIWRETPKSEFIAFQPVKREDIFSAKLLETDKFNGNIKVYSKPNKGKYLIRISNL